MFKKEYVHCPVLSSTADSTASQLTHHSSLTPGAKSKVKSSAQRAIRAKVVETYPKIEPYIDEILPKKEQLDLVKVLVDRSHS